MRFNDLSIPIPLSKVALVNQSHHAQGSMTVRCACPRSVPVTGTCTRAQTTSGAPRRRQLIFTRNKAFLNEI
jgi:hypothetical protein